MEAGIGECMKGLVDGGQEPVAGANYRAIKTLEHHLFNKYFLRTYLPSTQLMRGQNDNTIDLDPFPYKGEDNLVKTLITNLVSSMKGNQR